MFRDSNQMHLFFTLHHQFLFVTKASYIARKCSSAHQVINCLMKITFGQYAHSQGHRSAVACIEGSFHCHGLEGVSIKNKYNLNLEGEIKSEIEVVTTVRFNRQIWVMKLNKAKETDGQYLQTEPILATVLQYCFIGVLSLSVRSFPYQVYDSIIFLKEVHKPLQAQT